MAGGDLLLRTQSGLPVDVADAVARVRSGGAVVPKRRRSRRDAKEEEEEEGLAFSRVVTGRGRGVRDREDDVVEGEALEFGAEKSSADDGGGVDGSYLSETRFDQCAISPLSLKAVKDAGYERMTQVQEATLPIILQGKDVLAKAKTGTGKTVAFLLPAIEVLSTLPNSRRDQLRPSINLLVMCPTRELAIQVAVEAKKLLKYHRSLGVQVVIGGTRLTQEQRSMQANPCQILVATPGRLKDHVENTPGFSTRLKGVKVLVLDEADRLLDMGFRRDIERIIASVPKERQTLLFSATVPEEVRQISHIAMKKNYKFINTVKDGDEETHAQVSQMFMIAPLYLHFSILYDALKKHIAEDADYKVIIFCTTAMVTKLVAEILSQLRLNIREIHSRKSQSARTKVSDEFRKSRGLILVSSDVSARGVDYPDVTLVIQVGVPADRQQYIHRLGRTGRKGKEGQGLLLLAPWEKYFLSSIKDLSISEATVPSVDSSTQTIVKDAVRKVEMRSKECAYQAWLGYYNSNKIIGREKSRLFRLPYPNKSFERWDLTMFLGCDLHNPDAWKVKLHFVLKPRATLSAFDSNHGALRCVYARVRPFATTSAAAAAADDDDDDDDEDEIEIGYPGDMMSGGPSDATHRKRRRRRGPKGAGDGPSIPRAVTTNGAGPEEEEVVEGKAMELDAAMSAAEVGGVVGSHLSETRFDECAVSPLSLKAVKDAGYERMTQVQEATLPIILRGEDVLAKAKTGTGKTVAFLLPAIEFLSTLPRSPSINLLVICPTRELANQVAAEARKLLKYHRSLGVQVVIGGTKLHQEQRSMQSNPCQILVATPGRLKDHLENTPGFSNRIKGVKVLVLDEADRLLDMGFRRDIEKIIAFIPKERQTLLFSATVPEEVRQISHVAMKRGYKFINTVKEGDEETHSQVTQMYMVAPLDLHFSILYNVLKKHVTEDADYKVIVFCTTAMVTKLVAEVLSQLKLNVREIHSRKSQSARTKVSDEFRKSKGLILVSSDVSARGVDYPDVTLVIQVGLPADREQYIHRLGRTGRKGKDGLGLLLLAPWETYFLNSVQDLSVSEAPIPTIDSSIQTGVKDALGRVETESKESAYQAWLGYYNSNKAISRDKSRLVRLAEEFSKSMGLAIPPAIPKLILRKMGLNNVPGLRSV
uniref:ATP-dependent RNA helicase n=1 Tax=Oryza punctata TaxID=4537 RepID=A0A0E0JL87_ORYPU